MAVLAFNPSTCCSSRRISESEGRRHREFQDSQRWRASKKDTQHQPLASHTHTNHTNTRSWVWWEMFATPLLEQLRPADLNLP